VDGFLLGRGFRTVPAGTEASDLSPVQWFAWHRASGEHVVMCEAEAVGDSVEIRFLEDGLWSPSEPIIELARALREALEAQLGPDLVRMD
jgi:hypothetical protein